MLLPFFNKKKSKKGLIGVDFQPGRIAIAHIFHDLKAGDKPELKQCVFANIAPDVTGDMGVVSTALSKAAQSFPVSQFFCNSSIENTAYELLLIDSPNVESSELRQAVRWRIKDQLPYHIDDAVVDVFEIPGQQSSRAKLMYVVASQKQEIERRIGQLKQAGMEIQAIDIYELAQRNIAAILPEDKDGIVMLRFNDNSGLLTITRNGILFLTRKIDFGLNRLAMFLNIGLNTGDEIELSLDEILEDTETESVSESAENELLAEVQEQKQYATENPILNEQNKLIIDEVILEIQRSLDYYVSHFNQRAVTKIIFAPMVHEVPGVIDYIHDMLGIKTEVLDFNKCLNMSKELNSELQARCFDAIGLALRQEIAQEKSA